MKFSNAVRRNPSVRIKQVVLFLALSGLLLAKEPPTVVDNSPSVSQSTQGTGRTLKRKVAIARFTNETSYGRSFLVDNSDNPIGKQALDILSKKLLDTDKFILLERADMEKINAELGLAELGALKTAADYLIVGSITAFGRKNEGKVGVFTRTKTQTAFAKVTIRLIDVQSGMVLYAEEGSGEAYSEQKTTMGLGSAAGYDSSLNDKVLDAAISNLASKVIENLLGKPWKAYILAYADGHYVITGGKSQGLKEGDRFDVYTKGRSLKNPQTGLNISLPGKKVGQIEIEMFVGEANNEVAFATLISGELPKDENEVPYEKYFIQEVE
uniref:CsgG/HfaB family protein n=1 Tax=Rheinheimera sp. TaxID=1869214 RepID=UPI004047C004